MRIKYFFVIFLAACCVKGLGGESPYLKMINEYDGGVIEGPGLSNEAHVHQKLTQGDYLAVLQCVWSERDNEKRLNFLAQGAKDSHVPLIFEYAYESLRQNPTKETLEGTVVPYFTLGMARTYADVSCLEEGYGEKVSHFLNVMELRLKAMEGEPSLQAVYQKVTEMIKESKDLPSPEWIRLIDERALFIAQNNWQKTQAAFLQL